MFNTILIKYGEIGIKGKNRHLFEDALVNQIRHALKEADGEFYVHKEQGRIYVECEEGYDFDETVEALKCVFGIVGICPVMKTDDRGIEELGKDVIKFLELTYENHNQTFKVMTRRARKSYPMESNDVNCELGGMILDAFPEMRVDVHEPEIMLHVEIREKIYIYSRIIPGPGGMPVGTAGKAMLLLSGGIDSPVAGYMICKRGVKLDATYFHAPPYTSERAKQKVVDLARQVAKYSGPINLHVVNFTDIQLYIYEKYNIIKEAEKLLREFMAIPDNYKVMFLQGGASTQFTMLPLNLAKGRKAYYLVGGSWGKKAYAEAVKLSKSVPFEPLLLASSEDTVYDHIPTFDPKDIDPEAAYVHITTNNTIEGTSIYDLPDTNGVPIVADMSSNILAVRYNVEDFALIYAGAQKNIGPAGVTVVIVREINQANR